LCRTGGTSSEGSNVYGTCDAAQGHAICRSCRTSSDGITCDTSEGNGFNCCWGDGEIDTSTATSSALSSAFPFLGVLFAGVLNERIAPSKSH
jgi:hypothetical protein